MTVTTTKPYRYQISVTGEGGEFTFIRMTPEQLIFWREKGADALAQHLNGGCEEDGTPPEFNFGYYYDNEDSTSGIDLEEDPELVVQDKGGKICFKRCLDGDDFFQVDRVIGYPEVGGFFRTFADGALTYELKSSEPFDPSRLRLHVTDFSTGFVLNGVGYAGDDLLQVTEQKQCKGTFADLFG